MRPKQMPVPKVRESIKELPGWIFDEPKQSLHRLFVFDDFGKAWHFMAGVAETAERMNHHPDWSNSYNKVDVRLTTHDQGGVTQLDIDMAKAMNFLADTVS